MANILEYILSLKDQTSKTLATIGINSDTALNKFADLEKQALEVSNSMKVFGGSAGALREKLALLKNERDWIPANEVKTIRAYNSEIHKLEKQLNRLETINGSKLKTWAAEAYAGLPSLAKNPIILAGAAITGAGLKIKTYVQEGTIAYKEQAVAVSKLQQVMHNTMNARKEEVQGVVELTRAQQKLGVVSDNVQLAGSQELGTYLTKSENLKKLIPAMNDMLAQQYGLNATQEQSINIASMMGKVMDGQVGALSRYGYKFSEAQENILKNGTETQRAAVLFDVINSAVGGVNEKLAQTPEGKIKKAAMEAEDLKERVGGLATKIEEAWKKVGAPIDNLIGKVVSFFERNEKTLMALVEGVASAVASALNLLLKPIEWVLKGVRDLIKALKDGNPWLWGTIAVVSLLSTALSILWLWQSRIIIRNAILASWTKIVAFAKTLWAAATGALNIQLIIAALSTMGIVLAIMALIAIIAYVIYAFDGWGKAWGHLMDFFQWSWEAFKTTFALVWVGVQDSFLSGIETLTKAWYNLQALWDEEGSKAGLAKIENQQNTRAAEILKIKGKLDDDIRRAKEAGSKIFGKDGLHFNGKSVADIPKKLMNSMGAGSITPDAPVTGADNIPGGNPTNNTNEAIATGGTKNTTINISIGKQIEKFTIMTSNVKEGAEKLREIIIDEMTRAIAMSQSMAN